jgi:hypothetical protein
MLQEQIGQAAGEIYNYLSSNGGEATMAQMKKKLDLEGNFGDLGLGWLAREDKIEMHKKGASLNIKLK